MIVQVNFIVKLNLKGSFCGNFINSNAAASISIKELSYIGDKILPHTLKQHLSIMFTQQFHENEKF